MACVDEQVDGVLVQRELLRSSKCIAKPFEAAYQWMKRQEINLDSRETVGTIAFSGNGVCRVNHVTWSELVELHNVYERLESLEQLLEARWVEEQCKAGNERFDVDHLCKRDNNEGGIG